MPIRRIGLVCCARAADGSRKAGVAKAWMHPSSEIAMVNDPLFALPKMSHRSSRNVRGV
jgi:hypothetical protein